ncbi:MAG TPA: ABC transporter permease [Steroidobacteraceae bacterium]|jgi:putative ABC transport system permease protein|nr:ABC transporter permease [Steroidobacteraceae bacterium]
MATSVSQFCSLLGVYLRDWPGRIGTLMVGVAGAAGTTFIFVSVLAIANGVEDAAERAGDNDVVLVVQRAAEVEMASSLSDADLDAITARMNDDALSAIARTSFASAELVKMVDTISQGGEYGAQVLARGVSASGLEMRRHFRIVTGRAFTPGKLEVIVGRQLAREITGLGIGQTVTGTAQEWNIVGVFEDNGGLGESEVWMDLDTARMESGERSNVSSVRVRIASATDLSKIRALIEADPRHQLRVFTEREYQAHQSEALLRRVRLLAVVLALLLGIGAVIATMNAMNSVIAKRQQSVATLRALGFGAAPAAAAVFVEAALLGLVGGVIGAALSVALADGFGLSLLNANTHAPIALDAHVTFKSALQGVTAGALLGILAAVLPSVTVARTPILYGLR